MITVAPGTRMTRKRKNIVAAADFFAREILDLANIKCVIAIEFVHGMLKERNIFAECNYIKKGKIAHISIDANIHKHLAYNTIAHEMVHAKQWIKGELSLNRSGSKLLWNGIAPAKGTAYHHTDWEIEAMRKEILMQHEFCLHTERIKNVN